MCSENKGADHLRGYCTADLRLCLYISRQLVFSRSGLYHFEEYGQYTQDFEIVNSLQGHQSSSFIEKCNDNKIICGTTHYAAAEFETCKRLRVLLFYYQLLLF